MTLPPAAADRQLKHRRRFDVHVNARGNGLWEVDATLSDAKTREGLPGGVVGSTRISELVLGLPTAVIQADAFAAIDTRCNGGKDKAFQIDRCHASKSDGEVVRWHHRR